MKLHSYQINIKHRNRSPKSNCTQWTVSEWEEIRLFATAQIEGWICTKKCIWAIKSSRSPLGKTDSDIAYIAKYVSDPNDQWHGYPVTPSRDADRPPTSILDSWVQNNLISRTEQARIIKGKF